MWPYSCESSVSLLTAAPFPSGNQKKGSFFLDLEPNRILKFKQAVVCVLRNVVSVIAVAIANVTWSEIRPGVRTKIRKGNSGSRYTQEKVVSSSSSLASFRVVSSGCPKVAVRPCFSLSREAGDLSWQPSLLSHSGRSLGGSNRSMSVATSVNPKTRARLKPLS